MAFKMKNPSVAKMVKMAGNNRTAMKMKAEEAAAMKMKKAAMKKAHEDAAMKKAHEAAMKLKKESAMKAAKPDFPDIDGDGDTSESMKKAAADKKSGMKMKKESSMKMGHKSPAKMGHSPKKMKKESAMQLSERGDVKRGGKTTKYGKKHDRLRRAGRKAEDKAAMAEYKGKEKKLARLDKKAITKFGEARDIRESAMKLSKADKKKAMDNAMPAAEKVSMSKSSMAGAKKYGFMDGGSFNQDKAKNELRRLSKMTGQTDSNRAKQAEIRKLMKAFS